MVGVGYVVVVVAFVLNDFTALVSTQPLEPLGDDVGRHVEAVASAQLVRVGDLGVPRVDLRPTTRLTQPESGDLAECIAGQDPNAAEVIARPNLRVLHPLPKGR